MSPHWLFSLIHSPINYGLISDIVLSTLKVIKILFYYIDSSVLLENIPLVKFIKTTSRTRVVYFPLSHTFIDDVILVISLYYLSMSFCLYDKKNITCCLKIWILFSSGKTIFYERAQRVSKILFLPLENKIHIFAPPCNILYIFLWVNMFLLLHYSSKIVLHKRKPTCKNLPFWSLVKKVLVFWRCYQQFMLNRFLIN